MEIALALGLGFELQPATPFRPIFDPRLLNQCTPFCFPRSSSTERHGRQDGLSLMAEDSICSNFFNLLNYCIWTIRLIAVGLCCGTDFCLQGCSFKYTKSPTSKTLLLLFLFANCFIIRCALIKFCLIICRIYFFLLM